MEKPRLLEQVRREIRVRQFSLRTEDAYVFWIKRYIYFHHKRHPGEMGEREITEFLTHLAVDRHVAPTTQNQALSALLFLYKAVLGKELEWMDEIVRAKRPQRVPTVFTSHRGTGNSCSTDRTELAHCEPAIRRRFAAFGMFALKGERH